MGFGNRVWGNETVMTYLKTGLFRYWVPTGRKIVWEDPAGKPGCDFFGLNHYARYALTIFSLPRHQLALYWGHSCIP